MWSNVINVLNPYSAIMKGTAEKKKSWDAIEKPKHTDERKKVNNP